MVLCGNSLVENFGRKDPQLSQKLDRMNIHLLSGDADFNDINYMIKGGTYRLRNGRGFPLGDITEAYQPQRYDDSDNVAIISNLAFRKRSDCGWSDRSNVCYRSQTFTFKHPCHLSGKWYRSNALCPADKCRSTSKPTTRKTTTPKKTFPRKTSRKASTAASTTNRGKPTTKGQPMVGPPEKNRTEDGAFGESSVGKFLVLSSSYN